MFARAPKWLVLWNVVLTVLLAAALATNVVLVQAGSDPPLRVYSSTLDDVGGDFTSRTADLDINSTTPRTLNSVTTADLSVLHPHVCIVTASATINKSSSQDSGYTIFGLSMDSTDTTVPSSDRVSLLIDGEPQTYETVSTVQGFDDISGGHTFRFSARKFSDAWHTNTVTASTITVVCVKKRI